MDHVFQCLHHNSLSLKEDLLEKWSEYLAIIGTPLAIRQGLYVGLAWWLLQGTAKACPRAPGFGWIYSSDVWATNAYSEQTSLGWGQLLRGRMSSLWGNAYVKEIKSSKPEESHEKWTKLVIKLLWKMTFAIWENRNEFYMVTPRSSRSIIQQETLQLRVAELYSLFSEQPSIIHTSASYLFETPLAQMQAKGRQYLLCWIRSVEIAIAYQESETARLQKQASQFFAGSKDIQDELIMAGASPVRVLSIREVDIQLAERYDLRLRGSELNPRTPEDHADFIPPAMFLDFTDSSYIDSGQKDIQLCADQSISSGEIEQLYGDMETISLCTSGEARTTPSSDSTYIDSRRKDVIL